MWGKAALGVAIATLALAPVVKAQETYSANPELRAVQIAEQFWGRPLPCQEGVHFAFEAAMPASIEAGPAQAGLRSGALAVSAWTSPQDPTCTIHLNTLLWSPASLRPEFHLFCDTVTHEVGHWLGYEDRGQSDAESITYPTIYEDSPNYDAVPGCVHHGYARTRVSFRRWPRNTRSRGRRPPGR
jgi:hypothetical protein